MRLRPRCLVAVLVRVDWWLCGLTVGVPFPVPVWLRLRALRLQMRLRSWWPAALRRWNDGTWWKARAG